ncbi:hypothetical protein EON77_08600 [bacterium]|nr:MAG: hypothetical protein EON77_08600 [bacterium]
MKLSGLSLLALLALALLSGALAGCGSSPSTPIAPDIPVSSATNGAGAPDLGKIKGAEHNDAAPDRQTTR